MIPPEALALFREGFDEESQLVAAIKRYLLSPEHKEMLDAKGISIEDVLNGRIKGEHQDAIYMVLCADWNQKLGFQSFGF